MNDTPSVSIIIPTYKRKWEYVSRAINSVQNQTYKNIEIIVVDDSPESYEQRPSIKKRMHELSSVDSRIKYLINEKNMGGSLARNRGINLATGDYITFLDDDDEYMPEKIEHQVAFMNDSNCDLSFEDMIIYNSKGDIVDVREYKGIQSFDNNYLFHYHMMYHMTGTPTFMFKAPKLKEIGGFEDSKVGQEFRLMLKSIIMGLSIRYYPICDVKIYKHTDESISSGKNKIDGEIEQYKFKQTFFFQFSTREKAFIRFRHYAVMAVAYMRNKMYFKSAWASIKAFFISPIDFFQQIFSFFKRINDRKH